MLEWIGRGGYGNIHRGLNLETRTKVAIKLLHSDINDTETQRD